MVGEIIMAKEEKLQKWKESRREERKEIQGKQTRQALGLTWGH